MFSVLFLLFCLCHSEKRNCCQCIDSVGWDFGNGNGIQAVQYLAVVFFQQVLLGKPVWKSRPSKQKLSVCVCVIMYNN